ARCESASAISRRDGDTALMRDSISAAVVERARGERFIAAINGDEHLLLAALARIDTQQPCGIVETFRLRRVPFVTKLRFARERLRGAKSHREHDLDVDEPAERFRPHSREHT